MNRPIIGITSSMSKNKITMPPSYFNAVFAAGGMPSYLPRPAGRDMISELVRAADGFLFAGGVDILPSRYGEETLPECGEIDEERDAFELALLDEVMASGKPVLGICRGIQLINVGLGGTLYQHLPEHQQTEPHGVMTHSVSVREGTLLSHIVYGDGDCPPLPVNSFHHQAVKDTAPTLRPCAFAIDAAGRKTFPEAVYMPGHPFLLGVQWHPELYYNLDEKSFSIFRSFVGHSRMAAQR